MGRLDYHAHFQPIIPQDMLHLQHVVLLQLRVTSENIRCQKKRADGYFGVVAVAAEGGGIVGGAEAAAEVVVVVYGLSFLGIQTHGVHDSAESSS